MREETKHSVVLVVGTGVTAGLSLVYSAWAGRILGPAENAVFTAAVSLVLWCQLALGPINGTVARFSAEYMADGRPGKIRTLAREVTRRVVVYGLIGLVIALALLKPLGNLLQFKSLMPLLVAYGMVCLTLLLSIARGVLRGSQAFGRYNVNIIFEAATRLVIGLALLQILRAAALGLLAYLLALTLTLLLAGIQLRRLWHGHEPEPVKGQAVKRFVVPMFIVMFISAGFHNMDMLFVKHYFLEAEAGIYGAAFQWARVMGTLVTPFTTLMLPLLTTLHTRGGAVTGPFLRVCTYFLLLAVIPLALFWLWPGKLIELSFGREFVAAAPLLLALGAVRILGYLSHMIALAGAAMSDFRFLYVYVPGLAVQVTALLLWHDSLTTVVTAVLAVQGITFAAMAAYVCLCLWNAPRKAGARRD